MGFNFGDAIDITYSCKMELFDMEYVLLLYEDQCKSIPEIYRAMIYKECLIIDVENDINGLSMQIQMVKKLSKDIISRSRYRQNMIRGLRTGRKAIIRFIDHNEDSYTIEDIFGILNLIWYRNYYPQITLFKAGMMNLTSNTGVYAPITEYSIKDIFSSIYQLDFSDVMRPPFEFSAESIDVKLKLLENKSVGSSFYIPNNEPIEQVILEEKY